jgi:hypothetical protein
MSGYQRFRTAFEALLDPRCYTIEWLDNQLASGKIRLWSTDDAAIIAEIKEYPTGARELHGLAAVGDMFVIVAELIPQAEKWGRKMECEFASISSREGWARVMAPFGYQPYQTTIRKAL